MFKNNNSSDKEFSPYLFRYILCKHTLGTVDDGFLGGEDGIDAYDDLTDLGYIEEDGYDLNPEIAEKLEKESKDFKVVDEFYGEIAYEPKVNYVVKQLSTDRHFLLSGYADSWGGLARSDFSTYEEVVPTKVEKTEWNPK